MTKAIVAVLSILFMVGTVSAATWSLAIIGVPGVSLGPINLGMTQTMVFNRLGMPRLIDRGNSQRCGPNCEDLFWVYQVDAEEDFVVSWTLRPDVPEAQAGAEFLFTDAKRTTVGGLRVGMSTLREAVERYGWWSMRHNNTFFWNSGFRLGMDESDTIKNILIYVRYAE